MGSSREGVTAIVAAHNEAPRIARVLDVLTPYPRFDEAIVVDDGSTDDTGEVAGDYPVTDLRVEPNQGKGHAMDVGVAHAKTDAIFFADADIVGLTHEMIAETLRPVLNGSCEMFILMRNRKIYYLRMLMHFIPFLAASGPHQAAVGGASGAIQDAVQDRSGPQSLRRSSRKWAEVSSLSGYLADGQGGEIRSVARVRPPDPDVRGHCYGRLGPATDQRSRHGRNPTSRWRTGSGQRRRTHSRCSDRRGSTCRPVDFVRSVFAHELSEDPGAPLVRALESLASGVSASVLLIVGLGLVVLILGFFLASLMRLASIEMRRSEG